MGHKNSFFNEYGEPDAEAAKRTLRKAKVKTPVKLTLHDVHVGKGGSVAKEFAALEKQLNDSGLFKAKVEGEGPTAYSSAAAKGEYQAYSFGWLPDFPDAESFIAPFFEKDNVINYPSPNKEIRKELIPRTRTEPNRADASGEFRPRPGHRRQRGAGCCRCGRASSTSPASTTTSPVWSGRSTPRPCCSFGSSTAE